MALAEDRSEHPASRDARTIAPLVFLVVALRLVALPSLRSSGYPMPSDEERELGYPGDICAGLRSVATVRSAQYLGEAGLPP
jgi:hypothetical protein